MESKAGLAMGRLLNGRARVDLSRLRINRTKPLDGARGLPVPIATKARSLRDGLVDALQVRNAETALDLLLRCAWEIEPSDQALTGWLPALVGLDELADQGQAIDQDGRLRDFIANTLRAQLAHAVPCNEPLWVVPAASDEAAAAWLLAVVSCQRGRPARPWLWARVPVGRPFVTVGRRFDAARHNMPDCKGHYGLIASESGLGIAALLGDVRSRERARAIAERSRRWRRDWTTPLAT